MEHNYIILILPGIEFEWDTDKASLNKMKHGVAFEKVKTVFSDANALLISDPDHSSVEDSRYILPGMSSDMHLLVVSHCYRNDDLIRIISARRATKAESKQYGERL